MRTIFFKKERRLPHALTFALAVLASAALTFIVLYLQYYDTSDITAGFEQAGAAVFTLNFLPVLLCMLFVLFVSGRLSVSLALVSVFSVVLTLMSRTVIILRQDPLVPADFSLGTEVLAIINHMPPGTYTKYFVLIFTAAASGAALVIFLKNKRINIPVRLAGAFFVLTAAVALNNTVYSDKELYESLPVTGNRYNLVNQYNTRGLIYCLVFQFNDTGVLSRKAPEGYKKDEFLREIEEDYPSRVYGSSGDVIPHIIIVMGEAFSELSDKSELDFSNYKDPLTNFKRLKQEGISGELVVPHSGGGTADTEFDMLTGMSKREEESASYAFRLLSKPLDSVASDLALLGVRSVFAHPGFPWFYNRQNVYPHLGFSEAFFDAYFKDAPTKGGYINEYDTVNGVIGIFEDQKRLFPGKPILEYCVTIQNHGPYENKYSSWEQNFNAPPGMTDSEVNILSNYFLGVSDQDENLGRLADYLNGLDEPVLLLYFGDHMPSIPADVFLRAGLDFYFDGSFNERLELYKTPYLFWQNKAYREINPPDKTILGESGGLMSVNFLGAALLELIGYGELSPHTKFLNELKRDIPVLTKDIYLAGDEYKMLHELTEREKEKILLYKQWQYYRLYEN